MSDENNVHMFGVLQILIKEIKKFLIFVKITVIKFKKLSIKLEMRCTVASLKIVELIPRTIEIVCLLKEYKNICN